MSFSLTGKASRTLQLGESYQCDMKVFLILVVPVGIARKYMNDDLADSRVHLGVKTIIALVGTSSCKPRLGYTSETPLRASQAPKTCFSSVSSEYRKEYCDRDMIGTDLSKNFSLRVRVGLI